MLHWFCGSGGKGCREQNGLSEDDARYVFQQLVVSVDYQLRIGASSRCPSCCPLIALQPLHALALM